MNLGQPVDCLREKIEAYLHLHAPYPVLFASHIDCKEVSILQRLIPNLAILSRPESGFDLPWSTFDITTAEVIFGDVEMEPASMAQRRDHVEDDHVFDILAGLHHD